MSASEENTQRSRVAGSFFPNYGHHHHHNNNNNNNDDDEEYNNSESFITNSLGQTLRILGRNEILQRDSFNIINNNTTTTNNNNNNNSFLNNATRNSPEGRRESDIIDKTVLYKQLKYSRVNSFNRLVTYLLCLLVLSVFFEIFSLGSTDWFVITNNVVYHSIGLFLVCRKGVVDICLDLTSAFYFCPLNNNSDSNNTGKTICKLSILFVDRYIIAMWVLSCIHFFCILLVLIITLRMTCRPTRSKSAFVVMCLLLFALPCGVTNIVLFYFYTTRYQSSCDIFYSNIKNCKAGYDWGFNIYIATICFNFFTSLTSFCLWTYSFTVRAEFSRLWKKRLEMSNTGVLNCSLSENEGNDNYINCSLQNLRCETENVSHLTAKELGVVIEGADDWLYDYKSDFFYSFKLDMFWDPLTRCYYSRKLRSWQVTPRVLVFRQRKSEENNNNNNNNNNVNRQEEQEQG